jgi:hypothetical protein
VAFPIDIERMTRESETRLIARRSSHPLELGEAGEPHP